MQQPTVTVSGLVVTLPVPVMVGMRAAFLDGQVWVSVNCPSCQRVLLRGKWRRGMNIRGRLCETCDGLLYIWRQLEPARPSSDEVIRAAVAEHLARRRRRS